MKTQYWIAALLLFSGFTIAVEALFIYLVLKIHGYIEAERISPGLFLFGLLLLGLGAVVYAWPGEPPVPPEPIVGQ